MGEPRTPPPRAEREKKRDKTARGIKIAAPRAQSYIGCRF